MKKLLKALEARSAQDGLVLTPLAKEKIMRH
jgi:hypothetical protein